MSDDIDISYSLDPSGYLVGVNAIDQANARLAQSTGRVVSQSTLLSRAWDVVTPKRAVIAGMLGVAQQAGALEQNLSSLSALSTTTGSSLDKLSGGINTLARAFPVGQAGAREVVEQFTRMGASAGGSTGKVLALAEASIKLGGATGDGVGQLAQGMTELSRATGNTSLDPKRFAALGDSLTTVSAMSGASATNVLSLSKSIAPMAQAAGIGATGILGISTALSSMGEDGLGAGTAISKMLNDMSKSVRDGTPELKTYAGMVGQTTEQFTTLFKANPAQALTKITEAIAKAGPSEGPRMLERIGIEGVRGTRVIQSLVAGGGLGTAVKTATDAYGSGSTQKASEAAYGGLNDSLTQLRDTSQQLAQAMGKPLLGALTAFTGIITKPVSIANSIASSGVGQAALTGAGVLGSGALLAKSLVGPIGTLAIGKQALSSGPLAALMAGIADSTGASADGRLGRVSRYGRQAAADQRAGGPGFTGMLGKPSQFIYDFVNPDGTVKAAGAPGDPNKIGRKERLKNYGFGSFNSFLNMSSQQLRNAAIPDFNERSDSMGASGNFQAGSRGAKAAYNTSRGGGNNVLSSLMAGGKGLDYGINRGDNTAEKVKSNRQQAQDSFDGVSKSAKAAAGSLDGVKSSGASAKDVLKAMGSFAGANVKAAGSLAGTIGKGALGLAGGLLGGPMGIGLGITAAGAGINYLMEQKAQKEQAKKDWSGGDIAGQINTYRESIGKAVEPTQTYKSQAESLQTQLTAGAKSNTWDNVSKISEEDRNIAAATKDKVVTKFSGTAAQNAARIQAMTPTMGTQELQAIKQDLLRQMDPQQAAEVIKLLPKSMDSSADGGGTPTDLSKAIDTLFAGNSLETRKGSTSGWTSGGPDAPLSDEQQKILESGTQGIAQRTKADASKFGVSYANDRQAKTYKDLIAKQLSVGNDSAAISLAQKQAALQGDEYANTDFSASQLRQYGGNAMRALDDMNGGKLKLQTDPGAVAQTPVQSFAYKQIAKANATIGAAFDTTTPTALQQATSKALETPGNTAVTNDANDQMIKQAMQTGMSFNQLTDSLRKTASAAGEGSAEWDRLMSTLQETQSRQNLSDANGMPGDTAEIQQQRSLQDAHNRANGPSTTDAEKASVYAGRNDEAALINQQKAKMTARLQMQFDTDKQAGRMKEQAGIQEGRADQQRAVQQGRIYRDAGTAEARNQASFNRQQAYAATDFAKNKARTTYDFNLQAGRAQAQFSREMGRAESDFGLQRFRQQRDFQIQSVRSQADYNLSRARSVRDFGIQAGRAEADYQTSRLRSIRDFNKQMTRQVEDGAKSMMNPYERLKAQATWDIGNLLNNLAEQQKAMEAQKLNLEKARKAGLSGQAIDQLGLGKAENSQQLATIAADLNPDTVKKLNAATAGRAGAAASLFTDASNKELTRSKADFNLALSDSEIDYAKSVKRSRADFAKSLADTAADFLKQISRSRTDLSRTLSDSEKDFKRSQARSAQDFARSAEQSRADMARSLGRSETDFKVSNQRSQKEFRINLANTRADLAKSIRDMNADASTARNNARADLKRQLANMAKDVRDSDRQMSSQYNVLTDAWGKVLNGKAVNWTRVFATSSRGFLSDMTRNFIPQFNAMLDKLGLQRGPLSAATQAAARNAARNPYGAGLSGANKNILGLHSGGPVDGRSFHDHQDNIDAKLTAGEFVHQVAAVRHYGTDTMRAMNEKRIPKEAIRGYAGGGYVRPISQFPSWPHWGYYPGGSRHPAIDWPGPLGTPIHSPFDGRVVDKFFQGTGYGNHIRMMHPGGIYSILGHMRSPAYVNIGQAVKQGQVVGPLGTTGRSTGPHVHLEMRSGGIGGAPFDYTKRWGFGQIWTGKTFGSGISGPIDLGPSTGAAAGLAPQVPHVDVERFAAPYRAKYKVPPNADYIDSIVNGLKVEYAYDRGGMLMPGGRGRNTSAHPEPVLTNEQWRNISALAKHAAVSLTENDVRGSRASQGVSITVNHTGSTTYDQRADFGNATIQVISQDPNEMARKLKAKAVSDRLTATRSTNRRNA